MDCCDKSRALLNKLGSEDVEFNCNFKSMLEVSIANLSVPPVEILNSLAELLNIPVSLSPVKLKLGAAADPEFNERDFVF